LSLQHIPPLLQCLLPNVFCGHLHHLMLSSRSLQFGNELQLSSNFQTNSAFVPTVQQKRPEMPQVNLLILLTQSFLFHHHSFSFFETSALLEKNQDGISRIMMGQLHFQHPHPVEPTLSGHTDSHHPTSCAFLPSYSKLLVCGKLEPLLSLTLFFFF
jgi:hypothetical protein